MEQLSFGKPSTERWEEENGFKDDTYKSVDGILCNGSPIIGTCSTPQQGTSRSFPIPEHTKTWQSVCGLCHSVFFHSSCAWASHKARAWPHGLPTDRWRTVARHKFSPYFSMKTFNKLNWKFPNSCLAQAPAFSPCHPGSLACYGLLAEFPGKKNIWICCISNTFQW